MTSTCDHCPVPKVWSTSASPPASTRRRKMSRPGPGNFSWTSSAPRSVENRKIVEELNRISRGCESRHGASVIRAADQRPRSLTESGRRKMQHEIDEGNAALVRRILHTKGTFDRVADEQAFQRHLRDCQTLQRHPQGQRFKASKLKPLRSRHCGRSRMDSPVCPCPGSTCCCCRVISPEAIACRC